MLKLSVRSIMAHKLHLLLSVIDGIGVVLFMRQALQRAGLKPADIDYVASAR